MAEFKANRRGIRDIFQQPGVSDFLGDLAEDAARKAKADAPRDTGAFAESIGSDVVTSAGPARVPVGRVYTTDPGGFVIEARTQVIGRSVT